MSEFDIKRIVSRFSGKFDELIYLDREHEIHAMVDNFNRRSYVEPCNTITINDFFFVWIGTLNSKSIEYIDVWNHTVKKQNVTIYYDSRFLLFNAYKDFITSIGGIGFKSNADRIIECQNDLYEKLSSLISKGMSFDDSWIAEAENISKTLASNLKIKLKLNNLKTSFLKQHYNVVDISTITDVFYDEALEKIYFQELILRGNAAAASDVLRLCLLYKKGGIYVDVDTLPSLVNVYGSINTGRINNNIVNVIRSEYYLRRWRDVNKLGRNRNVDLSAFEGYLSQQDNECLTRIKTIASELSDLTLYAPSVKVHKNLISIAAFENYYEYNNNIIAAVKGSKLLRIILREIKKRYKFIFKYGLEKKPNNIVPDDHYLSRLSNYRYDTLDDKDNVTLYLTGPSLILEVLLGVAYEILPVQKNISSLAMSYAFRLNCISIAFYEHTNYTPEHVRSSWM